MRVIFFRSLMTYRELYACRAQRILQAGIHFTACCRYLEFTYFSAFTASAKPNPIKGDGETAFSRAEPSKGACMLFQRHFGAHVGETFASKYLFFIWLEKFNAYGGSNESEVCKNTILVIALSLTCSSLLFVVCCVVQV